MHDSGSHDVLHAALLLTLACTITGPNGASAFVAVPSPPTTPAAPPTAPYFLDSRPQGAGRSTGRRRISSALLATTSTSTPRRPGPGAGGADTEDEQALPELNQDEVRRYSRHLILPDVGVEGQRLLKASSVLAVGTGGLGSPALLYLAAAGVGRLGIVDDDVVDESNLQRQVRLSRNDGGSECLVVQLLHSRSCEQKQQQQQQRMARNIFMIQRVFNRGQMVWCAPVTLDWRPFSNARKHT